MIEIMDSRVAQKEALENADADVLRNRLTGNQLACLINEYRQLSRSAPSPLPSDAVKELCEKYRLDRENLESLIKYVNTFTPLPTTLSKSGSTTFTPTRWT